MAKKKKTKKKNKPLKKLPNIAETENSGFGEYDEYNGGGSPKGGIWGGKSGRIGWVKRVDSGEVSEGEHREDQPRTSDGKFTYNSVNGIVTKYPGRGKTVNPLLTEGENGIYIDDVVDSHGNVVKSGIKGQFERREGELYDRYKSKFFQEGSGKVVKEGGKYHIQLSNDSIWDIGIRAWDLDKGEITGESENWNTRKRGNPGIWGGRAKKKAKQTGSETYVTDDEDFVLKMGAQAFKKTVARVTKDLLSGVSSLKHTQEQIKAFRKQIQASGKDDSQFTDEQIDQLLK